MRTRQLIPSKSAVVTFPSFAPAQTGLLQRKTRNDSSVHAVVHEVLRSAEQPIDRCNRASVKPWFSHDFSQVPNHDAPSINRAGTVNRQPVEVMCKLASNQPKDQYEKEAEEVADHVVSGGRAKPAAMRGPSCPRSAISVSPAPSGLLRSQGQPLDTSTRRFMESGMSHDFGHVRVHTDPQAAESARSIQALAFTVGQHVAFAPNQYDPSTLAGRHLLAHELTHVVQQTASHSAAMIQRRSIFETIGIFLGLTEGKFSDKELHDYLDKITKANKIEDSFDSDNKARAIARKWRASNPDYNVTAPQKALLILEMDTGYVGSEDERGILDLLENSDDTDLRSIFTAGRVKAQSLLDNFSGKNLKELRAFFGARFKGGEAALLKGAVDPQSGAPVGAPKFPYSWTVLKAKIASNAPVKELLGHLGTFTSDERDQAVRDLARERAEAARQAGDLRDQIKNEKDPARKSSLQDKARERTVYTSTMDLILQNVSKDIALVETPASLSAKTKIPSSAEKADITKALKPDVKTDVKGVALPFASVLSGEAKTYEEKLRDYIPGMIANYYSMMVAGKGPAEHGDPTKVHSLNELEDIGNVSVKETNAVFGAYKTGPALKADTKLKRGNIHDLWADTEKQLSGMSKKQRRDMAKALMFYFFQSDDGILETNHAHNADPKFTVDNKAINAEAKSLEKLADEFTGTDAQVKKLNEIDRGWDASAGGGQINIQIFKKPTADEDRDFLWDMFQTLIHEYLHTLKHTKYDTYAKSFGGTQSNEFNTLIEGVDSYLDEVVWANIQPRVNDPALRAQIEGPVYSKLPPITVLPASRRRYPSYEQAIKLVNIVGPRNVYAAYFLGEIDKIGA